MPINVLITGATGYIGHRLLALLCSKGYRVVALVRSKQRLNLEHIHTENLEVLEGDLCDLHSFQLPRNLDAAYYLVHSLREGAKFEQMERLCAKNFTAKLRNTNARKLIYLSGLHSGEKKSAHLRSRHLVEEILCQQSIPVLTFRSGPIIGSGSAIFEILRDLVERLPIIVMPKVAKNLCQPIAICDVLHYLLAALERETQQSETIDLAGPDVMTYQMLVQGFARARGLKRLVFALPGMPFWLANIGLYGMTTVHFKLAKALLQSMRTETKANLDSVKESFPTHHCLSYEEALRRAFACVSQNAVFSHWHDALTWSHLAPNLSRYIQTPELGCVQKRVVLPFSITRKELIDRIWSVGGKNGWYAANWAWRLRGLLDRLVGGVGLRRGRTHLHDVHVGDCLDFWRVLVADRELGRLLLYAEMKMPGQAWLEFRVFGPDTPNFKEVSAQQGRLELTATFRPRGIFGRLYWYALLPIHLFIFRQMARAFVRAAPAPKGIL